MPTEKVGDFVDASRLKFPGVLPIFDRFTERQFAYFAYSETCLRRGEKPFCFSLSFPLFRFLLDLLAF